MVDNRWHAGLGRRKSWIVPMQAILAACLLLLGFLPLEGSGLWMAVTALAIGTIAGATQDTATDGLADQRPRDARHRLPARHRVDRTQPLGRHGNGHDTRGRFFLRLGADRRRHPAVSLAIGLLSVASGFIAVSAATIIMAFGGAGKQAGTDVTVLQSANVLGEMAIAGLVVWVAGRTGYAATFAGATVALVFAVLFVSRAARALP